MIHEHPMSINTVLACLRRNTGAVLARTFIAVVALVGAQSTQAVDTSGTSGDVREMLLRADRIRFPADAFQVDVVITTTAPDTDPEERSYRILSKGNDKTLVQTTAPAIDRNQILLMRDHDLWAFLPNLSQPIRLPLSQRLTGQVANGDLARANFVGDYEPTLLRDETIGDESHHVLQLDAVDQWVTYRRVLYWVNAKSGRPLKAEFYAVSGRLLKTCRYLEYQAMGGETRPTRLVIEDALRAGNQSVMVYSAMSLRELPDKIFTKDYLKILGR
jgi:outer membrane lipoprotein-sorting protein